MSQTIDLVIAFLVIAGSLLLCVAALGFVRSGDPFGRIQAVTKAGSLGAIVLLLGMAVGSGDFAIFMRAIAASALILVNTALMAQILAEAADKANPAENELSQSASTGRQKIID